MNVILFILGLPLFVAAVLHESGHAIMGLLFFRGQITLYLGFYGDPANKKLRLGRLLIYFKPEFLSWSKGMCSIPLTDTFYLSRSVLYALGGPLFTLIGGIVSLYCLVTTQDEGLLKLLYLAGMSVFFLDFFMNIIPNGDSIELYDGSLIYNDGTSIKILIKHHHQHKHYQKLNYLFQRKLYTDGIEYFKTIEKKEKKYYSLALWMYYHLGQLDQARAHRNEWEDLFVVETEDLLEWATFYHKTKEYRHAVFMARRAVALSPDSPMVNNNLGYYLNMIGEFEEAISFLVKVPSNASFPLYAYSLNNRGYSKLKIGALEEGFQLISESLRLKDDNAYVYRNLGIYYELKEENAIALEHYQKVYELDPETDELKELMQKALAR